MRNAILRCTGCGATHDINSLRQRCERCQEPLEVAGDVRHARVNDDAETLLERFSEFLPLDPSDHATLSLGEGSTPLTRSRQLESMLKAGALWFKVEGQNPTGSFKDRGTVAAVTWAIQRGIRRVGTVSTGNMGGSVAAYAARAGLPCTVITSPDTPDSKLGAISIFKPRLARLTDGYADAYDMTIQIRERTGTYFINSDDPFRVEGQKTLALELLHASGTTAPDLVIVPVSSGGNASGLLKGFREWQEAGLGEQAPRLLCVQSTGCAPIAGAFEREFQTPLDVGEPHTIAHAISNPRPPSGARLLRALGQGEAGWVIGVTDREIEAAQALLAEEEGLFVQPDAAASLAGLMSALRRKVIPTPRRTVLILTGHGLKDPSVFDRLPVTVQSTSARQLAELLQTAPATLTS